MAKRVDARRRQRRGRTRTAKIVAIALIMGLIAALAVSLASSPDSDTQAISSGGTTTTSIPMAEPTLGADRDFDTTATGNNGRTRIERSLPCDGTDGDSGYWHLQTEEPLPGGVLTAPDSTVPGDLRLFADLHSPHHTIRVSPEPVASPGPLVDSAYLLPESSRVALSNSRGTVKLALVGGECPPGSTPFDFDGAQATGSGTWALLSSSGAYRDAEASGNYGLDAGFLPGADNPWDLRLNGSIRVLQPELDVRLADMYWGRDGVDYLARQVAAVYQVTNIGAGDSFGAQLTDAFSPTPGASLIRILINGKNLLIDGNEPIGGFPRSLGDLASGEQVEVTVVWQLPLPSGSPPCGGIITDCEIDTTLTFLTPDALDLPVETTVDIHLDVPDNPPPL